MMIQSRIKYLKGFLAVLPLLMISCVDEDLFTFSDPAKIEDAFSFDNVIWSPAFTAPVGKTSVSLNRLFEEYNSNIEFLHLSGEDADAIRDSLNLSEYADSTLVIYNDSLYLSNLPAIELDTIIQFSFGLDAQGLNEQTPKIKYVTLIFNLTNSYPTMIESQAYFLDAGQNRIQSLFEVPFFVDGGAIDATGRVIEAKVNPSQFATFREDDVDDILGTEYIQLYTRIWLKDVRPEHYDEVMKFFSEYKVDIQIAVDFEIEVNVGDYNETP